MAKNPVYQSAASATDRFGDARADESPTIARCVKLALPFTLFL
jgi:hypothetical protein